eukprot:gene14927-16614_t
MIITTLAIVIAICSQSAAFLLGSRFGLGNNRPLLKAKAVGGPGQEQEENGKQFKVAVLGASGGIGQPLSLLLKLDNKVSDLSLFDIVRTPGVTADLSHINTVAKVSGFVGLEEIDEALKDRDVVLVTAGVPRQPGMTRDDLFHTNAVIIRKIAEACSIVCPNAIFLVVTNPVNSMVPIFAEVLKRQGVYNPRKLFGVTTLDVVRANTFVAEARGIHTGNLHIPVIGGHAGTTILPLFSQVKEAKFTSEEVEQLTHRVQFGGDEVVKAKNGAGSATLSMAYAAHTFTSRLLQAMGGDEDVLECAFVENSFTSSPFLATPVYLGRDGIQEVVHYGRLSNFEEKALQSLLPDLIQQVQKGIDFVKNHK